jgi:hypothetical protein
MWQIKVADIHVSLLRQQLGDSGEYTSDSSTPGFWIYGTESPRIFSRWCRAYEEAGAPYTVL